MPSPALSKTSLILVQLAYGPSTRLSLATALGYSASVGVSREVNLLIRDSKIIEDTLFRCPYCEKELEGIPIKKEGKLLRLTPMGEREATTAKETLAKVMGLSS